MGDRECQLPRDYYGADVMVLPAAAEPAWSRWPLYDEPRPTDPAVLAAARVEQLRSDREWLRSAISTLQASVTAADIVANLPIVLTAANGLVHGTDGHWDHRLAATCRDWIATSAAVGAAVGAAQQLRAARDAVAAAADPIAAVVDDWIVRGDALAPATEGADALDHLARVAAAALARLARPNATCPRFVD